MLDTVARQVQYVSQLQLSAECGSYTALTAALAVDVTPKRVGQTPTSAT